MTIKAKTTRIAGLVFLSVLLLTGCAHTPAATEPGLAIGPRCTR